MRVCAVSKTQTPVQDDHAGGRDKWEARQTFWGLEDFNLAGLQGVVGAAVEHFMQSAHAGLEESLRVDGQAASEREARRCLALRLPAIQAFASQSAHHLMRLLCMHSARPCPHRLLMVLFLDATEIHPHPVALRACAHAQSRACIQPKRRVPVKD